MHQEYHFMADCTLPNELTAEFFELLPYQDNVVNKYLAKGKLINYAFSVDSGKLWAVFSASSAMEVFELLREFPLTQFMEVEVNLLSSYSTLSVGAPHFSLN